MTTNGWQGLDLVEYGEGYGAKAWLIPLDAMIPLGQTSRDHLDAWAATAPVLPA